MRAEKRDVVELFGYRSDDGSSIARDAANNDYCPFIEKTCTKTNHDKSVIYGVCSVSYGISKDIGTEVIVCPKRLYTNTYSVLQDAVDDAWPDQGYELITGGTLEELGEKAKDCEKPAIAFGQHSGNEVEASGMSMDWVIQTYENNGRLEAEEFIGIEVQSIDTTGNYRDNREAYMVVKQGKSLNKIPNSEHGLNWANVHKRLIPQLIRKGNIYRRCDRCAGVFFVVPEMVYRKFEELLGNLSRKPEASKDNISIVTYGLGEPVEDGERRQLNKTRTVHIAYQDFSDAFSNTLDPEAPRLLDEKLRDIIPVTLF
jgi:hypothetical protein